MLIIFLCALSQFMLSSTHHFEDQLIPSAILEPSSSHASNKATSPCKAVLIPLCLFLSLIILLSLWPRSLDVTDICSTMQPFLCLHSLLQTVMMTLIHLLINQPLLLRCPTLHCHPTPIVIAFSLPMNNHSSTYVVHVETSHSEVSQNVQCTTHTATRLSMHTLWIPFHHTRTEMTFPYCNIPQTLCCPILSSHCHCCVPATDPVVKMNRRMHSHILKIH